MKVLSPERWLFAIKLLLAALLAYAVSVHAGLQQNYWAIATCCVVMNPATGAIRSKAIYRFSGTLGAGAASLVLASLFDGAPLPMILCTGVLSTAAFAGALLDRTPRAYGLQLFGVTVILVVVASVDAPASLFDTAVARVSEICVGIACCALVDGVLAPRSLAPVVYARLQSWLDDMGAWMRDAMAGSADDAVVRADRHRVIVDITAMSMMAGHLAYDPHVRVQTRQCVFAIQGCLLRLVPLLSSLETMGRDLSREAGDGVTSVVRQSRANLVAEIEALWADVRQLHTCLVEQAPLPARLSQGVALARAFPLPPDVGMAMRVAGGVLLAYTVLCGAWWATGWSHGGNAVLMGVLAVGFFGNLDNAGQAIGTFANFCAMALVLACVVAYGLLPLAPGFPALALVLALFVLPIGAWAATNPMAILLLGVGISNMNLQAVYAPTEWNVFLDTCVSSMVGIFVAQTCIGMVRRMGSVHALQRLAQAGRADLLRVARQAGDIHARTFANRGIDRIAATVQRQPAASNASAVARQFALLRAGLAIAALRGASTVLTGEVRAAVDAILRVLPDVLENNNGAHALLPMLDDALGIAGNVTSPRDRDAVDALARLRMAWPDASAALEAHA